MPINPRPSEMIHTILCIIRFEVSKKTGGITLALPKRRISKSRRGNRKSHWKLNLVNSVECPHCHQPKLPHRVCPNCGYYNGREVITIKEK